MYQNFRLVSYESARCSRFLWAPTRTDGTEALFQRIWSSNRAFRVDRPIHKLTKYQPAIAPEQKVFPAHFKLIEDIS